jgi:N6-adenosine-specific RNA methylase IME4
MTEEDLYALPISGLAARDAVLLLWATWPKLDIAINLIGKWGFRFVSGFPWIKITGDPSRDLFGDLRISPRFGVGFWTRGCSEAVLIGRRGDVSLPADPPMGILSENFGHSRKPDNLYQYAELFAGPFLELFARRRRAGWDAFGDSVDGSINIGGGENGTSRSSIAGNHDHYDGGHSGAGGTMAGGESSEP